MKNTDSHQNVLNAYPHERTGNRVHHKSGEEFGDEGGFYGGQNNAIAYPFDFLSLAGLVVRQWLWIVLGCLCASVLGLMVGLELWEKSYTATAQLVRQESANTASIIGDRQVTAQTFAGLLRSPDLIERVSSKLEYAAQAQLGENIRIVPERNSEILTVAMNAKTADEALKTANLYASEAVDYTKEMQGESANEISRYIQNQLSQINREILSLNLQWRTSSKLASAAALLARPVVVEAIEPAGKPTRTLQLSKKLDQARDELFDLLTRYTELHPLVQAQQSKIGAIEKQMLLFGSADVAVPVPPASNNIAVPPLLLPVDAGLSAEPATDLDIIRTKLTSLEESRITLLNRQNTLELFEKSSPGIYRILLPATMAGIIVHDPAIKVAFLTAFGAVSGGILAALILALRELFDDRIKTAEDVKRVTKLPVLARLDNFECMSSRERRDWAFRAWTRLQNRIGMNPNQGLVCGFTASTSGEERSVCLNLLAQAASQCGFKVLTISTKEAAGQNEVQTPRPSELDAHTALNETLESSETALQTPNVLASPSVVSQRLTGEDAQPLVHIPLPGWVWNLERRKQWKAALEQWQQIDNVVILVELPPASSSEAVLLAENLPNLIWLSESGKASATETRAQLDTLRNACCNIVGAVLTDDSSKAFNTHFSRWVEPVAS